MEPEGPYVVAVGGLNEVTFFGPFETKTDAELFAQEEVEESFTIIEVMDPSTYEAD